MTVRQQFQIDFREDEVRTIDRLGGLTGLQTKKDVIMDALTLFRWAAQEIMHGRTVCSVDERTGEMTPFELSALSRVAEKRAQPLSDEQVEERIAQGGRRFSEFMPKRK